MIAQKLQPQYVSDDYYCESGVPVFEPYTFHYDNPLWDDKQCDYLSRVFMLWIS